jgi:thiosulfate reductase cytochrome b subunit
MPDVLDAIGPVTGTHRHARWVRICHWLVTASVLTLAFTGLVILMAHPRLYWGDVGNDLTPALIELPISRNYKHGGWSAPTPIVQDGVAAISADRTYDIFNQNGWARSLHFLAAWWLVLPGATYVLIGMAGGHFRSHILPRTKELALGLVWRDVVEHLHLRVPRASGGAKYGVLQKCAYSVVVFVAAPLMVASGLAMSPAVTAAVPVLLRAFNGYQSARTIHFVTFIVLLLFVFVHVVMVIRSGFGRQVRAMTVGE